MGTCLSPGSETITVDEARLAPPDICYAGRSEHEKASLRSPPCRRRLLACRPAASFADYTLNILHINDWHSRIESNNKFESTCSAEEEGKGECIGGAARLVTAINDRRKTLEGQNVLLLNGGDNFQGSLFYTTYKGKAEAEFLNQMKFDAMTVGNHEFDDGEDALVPFLDEIKFPVLSAPTSRPTRQVQGRRPHQAVGGARGRRPEDRHRRRGHQRHAGGRLARPQHHDRGRRQERSPPRSRS